MKKNILISAVAVAAVLTAGSCALAPFFLDKMTDQSIPIKVDIRNATAIAGTSGTSGSRSLSPRATTDKSMLVKFLGDGKIESIIDYGNENMWKPDISFISVGDDGSVYLCFSSAFTYTTQGQTKNAQLLRIFPDSTDLEVIWPINGSSDLQNGTINTWGWWGMETDPMHTAPDGTLYFTVSTSDQYSTKQDIFKYNPKTGGEPVLITPSNSELGIESFIVDSKKNLFIKGSADNSGFLRLYQEGKKGYQNIYYSSDKYSNNWVRGYTSSPDGNFLVLNGNEIRDMSGLIKVSGFGNEELSYELMYGSSCYSNWIDLVKEDEYGNGMELLTQSSNYPYVYSWIEDLKNQDGSINTEKICARVQPYFMSKISIKTDKIAFITEGNLENEDAGKTLREWISNNAESFLRNYFDGTLFNDWLEEQSFRFLDISNIGTMVWASDGSLYGLCSDSWWGNQDNKNAFIVKLLDRNGSRALQVLTPKHSGEFPSILKFNGDYLYYRYAILDSMDQQTGRHGIARINIVNGTDEELLPADLSQKLEVLSYDFSSDDRYVYFAALNPAENASVNGRIDVSTGTWEELDSSYKFDSIKVID